LGLGVDKEAERGDCVVEFGKVGGDFCGGEEVISVLTVGKVVI
jgi:hypothetical protein